MDALYKIIGGIILVAISAKILVSALYRKLGNLITESIVEYEKFKFILTCIISIEVLLIIFIILITEL